MKLTTLCFLIKDDEILLAMKKRGFGVGRWNGVGGKVHEGESIEAAAVREAKEEIGVTIREENLTKVAVQRFEFKDRPDLEQECHVFLAHRWRGEPVETEEMAPRWFSTGEIPWKEMWVDDPYWLPLALEGKRLKNRFLFSADTNELLSQEVAVVPETEAL